MLACTNFLGLQLLLPDILLQKSSEEQDRATEAEVCISFRYACDLQCGAPWNTSYTYAAHLLHKFQELKQQWWLTTVSVEIGPCAVVEHFSVLRSLCKTHGK